MADSSRSNPQSSTPDPLAAALRAIVAPIVREAVAAALEEHREGEGPREQLLDTEGLCAFLRVSTPTVRKLLAEGLPHVMAGEHRRYERASILDWMRSRGGSK